MRPYWTSPDGRLTVHHGESLAVLQSLDVPVTAVVADPPYSSGGMMRGDRMESTTNKYGGFTIGNVGSKPTREMPEFTGDTRDQRAYAYWSALWLSECLRLTVPGGLCFVFTDWRQLPTTTDALQAGGWVWRGLVVWDKGIARPIRGRFRTNVEFVVWGSNGPLPAHADVYPSSVVSHAPPSDREHLTQKPEPLLQHLLSVAPPGGTVLDPFMGSGTSLVAARNLGHGGIGIEINERFCRIAQRRLEDPPMLAAVKAEQITLLEEAV